MAPFLETSTSATITSQVSPATANPLTSKISGVLSASFADSDFKEALLLLDDTGIANNAKTRRQIRLDVQKDVIDSHGEIIGEFGLVAEQLRRIGATVSRLNQHHENLKRQIVAAHAVTTTVRSDCSSILAQRNRVVKNQQLLDSFRGQFTLDDAELTILTSTAEPINDKFFACLTKAQKISMSSEVLLGFECQTLGLEIMEQTSKNINMAFHKLYRWVQHELKALNLDNFQIGGAIRRALRVLAERPSLFHNCLDTFATAREHSLSDMFYTALTGNSPTGVQDVSVKPIELTAYDQMRYVGDMLAWIHSAAVGEREALEVLFVSEADAITKGMQIGRETDIWRLVDDEAAEDQALEFDPVKSLNVLVDKGVSGAIKLMRQRVEQVIQLVDEDTLLAYKLANLLGFYAVTFSRLLTPQSTLVKLLLGLEKEAMRQFRSLLRDHFATLQGEFQHVPADLSPPDFFVEALQQLSAFLRTYDTSLTASLDREEAFLPVLSEAFGPYYTACQTMATDQPAPKDAVFALNVEQAGLVALQDFDFVSSRCQLLRGEVDGHAQQLVGYQVNFFRRESGLGRLFDLLEPLTDEDTDLATLRSLEAAQPVHLETASRTLDVFLSSAFMDAMDNIKGLQDLELARKITEKAAEKFCADFEHVENLLMAADETIGQDDQLDAELPRLRAAFPRSSNEVRVLLS